MRLILNLIWFVLSGIWMFFGYLFFGFIACCLIVTIPFGIAAFRIGAYALWPFGRSVVDRPGSGAASLLGNIIWAIFGGVWLAIGHLVTGIAMCLTIIGIPLGLGSFKLIPVSLFPLGKEIVPSDSVVPHGRTFGP